MDTLAQKGSVQNQAGSDGESSKNPALTYDQVITLMEISPTTWPKLENLQLEISLIALECPKSFQFIYLSKLIY